MQGPICRGGAARQMVVPGQTDWRRGRFSRRALCSAWPIILHPKTFSGAGTVAPALTAAKTPDPTQTSTTVEVLKEDPISIKRRHAQASPVLGCCR